jgi:hypothetical protein
MMTETNIESVRQYSKINEHLPLHANNNSHSGGYQSIQTTIPNSMPNWMRMLSYGFAIGHKICFITEAVCQSEPACPGLMMMSWTDLNH